VVVTASPEAEIGRFNIDVTSVASNHRVAGVRYDDANAALGLEGSFDLSVGDFTVTVDVSSEQSLKDVAGTVNAAVAQQAEEAEIAPPLSARILDNTLIFEARQTGSENVLSVTDSDGLLANLGIVDGTGNFTNVLQEPADAQITLDGLDVTRSSNTIDDLIEGVTIEVTAPGSAQVDVSLDAEPAVTGVKSMLEAYNETLDWINIRLTEESEEDPESDVEKKWGLLKGDRLLWSCKQDMRSITSKIRNDLEGEYKSLSSIGITTESVDFGKSGKLQFDESAFMEAMLDDPRGVGEVLRSFAEEMQGFTKQMISGTPESVGGTMVKTGTIINRIDTLEKRSSRIDERIVDFEARLEMEQASLEKLYANMERRLSEMNQQSYYFSALLDQGLSNSSK
jgi:flagellar hook-associated protein 2